MKVRRDFVTNSSSSSFVISRDDVSRDELKKILLEIANAENYYDDEPYTEDDVSEDCVAYRYHIKEATKENPHVDWDDREYDNDYIIDNDDCGRYDWDAIEEVLNKHNIAYRIGYCD